MKTYTVSAACDYKFIHLLFFRAPHYTFFANKAQGEGSRQSNSDFSRSTRFDKICTYSPAQYSFLTNSCSAVLQCHSWAMTGKRGCTEQSANAPPSGPLKVIDVLKIKRLQANAEPSKSKNQE